MSAYWCLSGYHCHDNGPGELAVGWRVRFVRLVTALGMFAIPLIAQQIHVTADLLSTQTTGAMFGRLPATYGTASVAVCNDAGVSMSVPLAFAAQQVRPSGLIMLPKDAALSIIAAAQGSSVGSRLLRGSIAALQIAAIAAGWSTLGATVKNTLTSSAIAGSSALSVISTSIPSHVYLTLSNEALPDPMQLGPFGCVSGVVMVEKSTGPGINTTIPAVNTGETK